MHKIFAGPMSIIPKVRNTIRKKTAKQSKCTKVSGKQFGTNGFGFPVKRRFDVLYEQ